MIKGFGILLKLLRRKEGVSLLALIAILAIMGTVGGVYSSIMGRWQISTPMTMKSVDALYLAEMAAQLGLDAASGGANASYSSSCNSEGSTLQLSGSRYAKYAICGPDENNQYTIRAIGVVGSNIAITFNSSSCTNSAVEPFTVTGTVRTKRQITVKATKTSPASGSWTNKVYATSVKGSGAATTDILNNAGTISVEYDGDGKTTTPLAALPTGVTYPGTLNATSSKMSYISTGQKKLVLQGGMTETEKTNLLALSSDTNYQAAVNTLFTNSNLVDTTTPPVDSTTLISILKQMAICQHSQCPTPRTHYFPATSSADTYPTAGWNFPGENGYPYNSNCAVSNSFYYTGSIPNVVYIKGNAKIKGNMTVHGIFVVENGNFTLEGSAQLDGIVVFNGGGTLNGGSGDPDVKGVIAYGSLDGNGQADVQINDAYYNAMKGVASGLIQITSWQEDIKSS